MRRDSQAERFGRAPIDHELESRQTMNRELGRVLAVEDAADIEAGLVRSLRQARAIAHETAELCKLDERVDRRQAIARCQRHDLRALADEQRARSNVDSVQALFRE